MANSLPGSGGVPPSVDPNPKLTPDEVFRCRIGMVSDSLTRMLDVLASQSLHHANKPYLETQLDLCHGWLCSMRGLLIEFPRIAGAEDDFLEDSNGKKIDKGLFAFDTHGPYERGA